MKILITILSLLTFMGSAYAAETVSEKAEVKTNDVKRSVKHKVHKVEEAICDKTDKPCLAKKAKHRAEEAKDYTKDKASEGKNIIDNDSEKK